MLLPSRRQLVPRGVYPPRCSVHLNDRRNSYEVSDLFVRDLGLLEPRGVETPVFSAWALGGGPVTPVDPVVLWRKADLITEEEVKVGSQVLQQLDEHAQICDHVLARRYLRIYL